MDDPVTSMDQPKGGGRAVSRRDVLKLSAVAAAAASTGAAGLNLFNAASLQAALNPDVFLENGAGKFKIDISGAPVASRNVQSIQVEDITVEVRETTTGADLEWRTFAPGRPEYGNITLQSRVVKSSRELQNWFQDASKGMNIRKNMSIVLLKTDGSEARRWNLIECFPVKWDPGDYSPSSNVAVETIVCKIGFIELSG